MESYSESPADLEDQYTPGSITAVNIHANEEPGSVPKYSILITSNEG